MTDTTLSASAAQSGAAAEGDTIKLTVGRVPPEQRQDYRAGKTYGPGDDGRLVKVDGHNLPYRLEWEEQEVAATVDALANAVRELQDDPFAVITRGTLADHVKARSSVYMFDDAPVWKAGRSTTRKHGRRGTLDDKATRLLLIDVDAEPEADGINFQADPGGAARWFIRNRLPAEFHGARCVWRVSSSGGTKPGIYLHLFFLLDRPLPMAPLTDWSAWWNDRQGANVIDPAPFRDWQIIYTSRPTFVDGAADPFPGDARLGVLDGDRETVELYVPTEGECREARETADAEAGKRARRVGIKNKDVQVRDGLTKIGGGWQGWLRAIGDRGSVRGYMEAAAATYFRSHGASADAQPLLDAMARAVEASPYLDTGEPGSRTRADGRAYLALDKRGRSNMGDFIAHVRENQRQSEAAQAEQEAEAVCEHPTFGVSLDEGQAAISDALSTFFGRDVPQAVRDREGFAVTLAEWHENRADDAATEFETADDADDLFAAGPPADRPVFRPVQRGLKVSTGAGKSREMVRHVGRLALADRATTAAAQGLNVVVFAPDHAIGAELAERIDEAAGSPVAVRYLGRDQEDPEAPGEKMCRHTKAVRKVTAAGGKWADVCAACPFNPGRDGRPEAGVMCGVHRQRRRAGRVWVLPASMLANAKPENLPDPDVVVLDEAPFRTFVEGTDSDRTKISVAELFGRRVEPDGTGDELARYRGAVAKLRRAFGAAATSAGFLPLAPFVREGVSAADVEHVARLEWRGKDAPGKSDVKAALAGEFDRLDDLASKAGVVVRRVSLLKALAHGLRRDRKDVDAMFAAPGVWLDGDGSMRSAWVKPIHRDWIGDGGWSVRDDGRPKGAAAVLYLDATAEPAFARAWLPDLTMTEVRVEAGHVHRVLVGDRFVYARNINPDNAQSAKDRQAIPNNVARVADLLESLSGQFRNRSDGGAKVLGVTYKGTREHLDQHHAEQLDGVGLLHFGKTRGVDRFKDVPAAVVVGRPAQPVHVYQRTAAVVFDVVPGRVPRGLPTKFVWPRMADGSDAEPVEAEYHPDPHVDLVYRQLTLSELEQSEGRVRAVQRGQDTPALVVMASSAAARCDLTFHNVTTWDALTAAGDAVALMQARGLVPKRKKDVGRMFDLGEDAKKAADAARGWFRDNPAAEDQWRRLLRGECVRNVHSIPYGRFSHIHVPEWQDAQAKAAGERERVTLRLDQAKLPTPEAQRAAVERYQGVTVTDLIAVADTAAATAPKRDPKTVDDRPKPAPADRPEPAAPPAPGPDAPEPRAAAPQHHDRPEKNVDDTAVNMAHLLAELGLPPREYPKLAKRAAKRRGVAGRFEKGRASREELAQVDMDVWKAVLARPEVDVQAAKAAAHRLAAATAQAA